MNRLANALFFAVVVITAFVLEARSAYPQYSPARVLGRVMRPARPATPPVVVGELPDIDQAMADLDQAKMDEAMARTETARQVFTRTEVRRIQRQARSEVHVVRAGCKITKLDQ